MEKNSEIGVVHKCQRDSKARAYCLRRSEEVPKSNLWRVTYCGECAHFERIDHPHLGRCAKGQLEALSGSWDTDHRCCVLYHAGGKRGE